MVRSYAVIGTGGVGGLYGARLADAGCEVHFLLHSDHDHVAAHGLRVDSVLGDVVLTDPQIHRSVDSIPDVDVVLVALKTTADDVLDALVPSLARRVGAVVLMQNGYGNEDELVARTGIDTLLVAGLCFVCSSKIGPGHIAHVDYGAVTLAPHRRDHIPALVTGIADDLRAAGVKTGVEQDLEGARWRKLCWNMPFNGTSVVLDCTPQALLADPDGMELARAAMDEVAQGAAATGHPLPDGFVGRMLRDTQAMTPYLPSMKLDHDAGRPLEVTAIYDRPIAAAARAGVAMPVLATIRRQVGVRSRSPLPVEGSGPGVVGGEPGP